jgi:tetratricopeptide (TPR) repeat protein
MADSPQERWKERNETGRRHFERAEYGEAEQAYIAALRQATLLGAVTLTELGQVAFSVHDFQRSESYFRRALTIREQAFGKESLDLMQALNDLAAPYYARGELEQAERLFRRALALGEAQLGELDPSLAVTLSNIARLHQRRGDWRTAAPLLGRLLAIKQRALGETHPHAISLMLAIAKARSALGEHQVAEELVRRALVLQERAQASDADIARSLSALAAICVASGQTSLAAELADRAAKRSQRAGGMPRVRNTRARLDRDTPDFSANPAPVAAAPAPRPATPAATPRTPAAAQHVKPGTPAAPGMMRAYAQMIESTTHPEHGGRRGMRRSWWARLFAR